MPSSKNILYLSTFGNLRWGGQKSLFQLVTRLDERYRPCVLVPSEGDFARVLREKGVRVVVLDLPPIRFRTLQNNVAALHKLMNILKEFNIALVHTDGPRNTFYAGVAGKLRRLPVVFHVRDASRDRYDALSCWLSARTILVARALRARFDRSTDDKKFVTVYNGLDLNKFRPKEAVVAAESGRHDADPVVTIVSTGRIEAQKGQKILVEACGFLKNRMAFRLILVGEIVDQAYARGCEALARQMGIEDHVIWAGYREDMAEILQDADIFALPSNGEAFSRAVIEAMAVGLPVVATDVGGTKEAVIDGVTGFVVPSGEARTMAEKMLALAVDEPLRKKFGAEARKRAEALFSVEGNVQKTVQVYDELLGGFNHSVPDRVRKH